MKPLCKIVPKIIEYVKNFDNAKPMPLLIESKKSLEKYNKTWEKGNSIIVTLLVSEPVHNRRYLKTKIKSYRD